MNDCLLCQTKIFKEHLQRECSPAAQVQPSRGLHTCLNSSRSSALSMEGSFAPISSTPYFSRIPCCTKIGDDSDEEQEICMPHAGSCHSRNKMIIGYED